MQKAKIILSFLIVAVFFYFVAITYPIPVKAGVVGFDGGACFST